MRARPSRWFALAAAALNAALLLAAIVFLSDLADDQLRLANVFNGIGLVPYLFVGPLLIFRAPKNAIGWLFTFSSLLLMAGVVTREYANHIGAAFPARLFYQGFGLLLFATAFLLFPNGRLRSRRWLPIPVLAVGIALVAQNAQVSFVTAIAVVVLGALSVLLRYRESAGVERQQLKWFAYSIAVALGCVAFNTLTSCNSALPREGGCSFPLLGYALWGLTFAAIPVGMSIAILRYRLYDIDLLINRTLVYGATSASIAITFFGGILALQALLSPFTSGSELAVAAATLVSFALFQPVRRRVQDAVDRRFDRSRYDAARTLDAFADRLRDEVDLDALRADLIAAVRTTIAPAHASLWLRERAP
jgi:hypothetical protein